MSRATACAIILTFKQKGPVLTINELAKDCLMHRSDAADWMAALEKWGIVKPEGQTETIKGRDINLRTRGGQRATKWRWIV
jgi:DNA-binding IclR family transcriptional regulator